MAQANLWRRFIRDLRWGVPIWLACSSAGAGFMEWSKPGDDVFWKAFAFMSVFSSFRRRCCGGGVLVCRC